MHKYALKAKTVKSVKVYGRGLRVSAKDSSAICKEISGISLPKGKTLVEGLSSKKTSLGGKYYTNAANEISNLLKSAEASAEFKGLSPERMFIHASAHRGFTFMTPRRFKQRGKRRRVTHIQLVLEQR